MSFIGVLLSSWGRECWLLYVLLPCGSCADPESFANSDNVILYFCRRERIQIPLKRNADNGPTFNAGLVALRILIISGDPDSYC